MVLGFFWRSTLNKFGCNMIKANIPACFQYLRQFLFVLRTHVSTCLKTRGKIKAGFVLVSFLLARENGGGNFIGYKMNTSPPMKRNTYFSTVRCWQYVTSLALYTCILCSVFIVLQFNLKHICHQHIGLMSLSNFFELTCRLKFHHCPPCEFSFTTNGCLVCGKQVGKNHQKLTIKCVCQNRY